MDFPGLIGPSYTGFSLKSECQRTMNLYLERVESGQGRGQYVLLRSPGLRLFTDTGGLTCRGFLEVADHLFDVQDDVIYDVTSAGSLAATYSPIANDGQLVSMAASQNSLFVVSVGVLYRINSGAMTTPATPFTPLAVVQISGLIVCLSDSNRQFFWSNDDGVTWNALDFQTLETDLPNNLVNIIVDHEELWVFCNRNAQVYVVGDDPDAPFVRVSAGQIMMGLAAKNALAAIDNSLFWLGKDHNGEHMVWRANGYAPLRISNHAVENAIRGYSRHDDAIMQSYQLNGHSCFRLTFPSANEGLGATWEYDISVNNWTEVGYWNSELGQYERHRGNCYVSAFGRILVGDYANGEIYEMSPDFYSDFGYPIRWERRAPHVTKDNKRIQYKRLEVIAQTGVGETTPRWLNDYSMNKADFDTEVAALVAAATITVQQGLVVTLIYDRLPFSQAVALPIDSVMEDLGFYEWARNPQIGMRYSNDGGNTWSAYTYRNLGRAGEFSRRLYWNSLGMGRDRVWELSGDAPVKTAIVGANFDAVLCDH